jgi:aminopeptidase N
MVLGTDETLNPWMDEGFTQWIENNILARLYKDSSAFAQEESYNAYFSLAKSGIEEPLSTPADHYEYRSGYVSRIYDKGAVLLEQLGYITGAETRDRILLEYFREWKFHHPGVNDFFRVAEKVSGLKLDWYRSYFVNSTKTIDYGIDSLWQENNNLKIRLKNNGKMPMPVDVMLTFKDGSREMAYIPQYLMFGGKKAELPSIKTTVFEPGDGPIYYTFEINRRLTDLKSIEIDPSKEWRIERKNNRLELNWYQKGTFAGTLWAAKDQEELTSKYY